METITVEVYLPGPARRVDFRMPSRIPIRLLLPAMADAVEAGIPGAKVNRDRIVLLQRGIALDGGKTLAEYGITEGSQLMLL